MENGLELRLCLALVLKADVLVLKDILEYIQGRPDVKIVYKRQSADNLYVTDQPVKTERWDR